MISEDELYRLAKLFDRGNTRVVTRLPNGISLADVVGVQNHPGNITKMTVRRGKLLYLCVVPTSEADAVIVKLKQEIKKHNDPEERWEPWELYGSTEPLALRNRLLISRASNKEEIKKIKGDV